MSKSLGTAKGVVAELKAEVRSWLSVFSKETFIRYTRVGARVQLWEPGSSFYMHRKEITHTHTHTHTRACIHRHTAEQR